MLKKIKENKRIKASIFFIFYFFFFLFIAMYVRKSGITVNNKVEENKVVEKETIKTYSISNLINNNYQYNFIVEEDNNKINFIGTNDKRDYEEFTNKYFFDIANINQIIKNSKYINTINNELYYEVENRVLNLFTNSGEIEGTSKINVHIDEKGNLNQVILDLSSYMKVSKYLITLNYKVGDNSE